MQKVMRVRNYCFNIVRAETGLREGVMLYHDAATSVTLEIYTMWWISMHVRIKKWCNITI